MTTPHPRFLTDWMSPSASKILCQRRYTGTGSPRELNPVESDYSLVELSMLKRYSLSSRPSAADCSTTERIRLSSEGVIIRVDSFQSTSASSPLGRTPLTPSAQWTFVQQDRKQGGTMNQQTADAKDRAWYSRDKEPQVWYKVGPAFKACRHCGLFDVFRTFKPHAGLSSRSCNWVRTLVDAFALKRHIKSLRVAIYSL
jgi:hypothetical protein